MADPEQFMIDHVVHTEVLASFRRRAARLRRYSVVIIVLIILVLVAGISIFIYAGQIANSESNPALQERRKHLTGTEAEIEQMSRELYEQRAEVARLRNLLEQEVLGTGGTRFPGHGPQAEYLHQRISEAEKHLIFFETRIQKLSELRDTLRTDIIKAEEAAKQSSGTSQSQIPVLVSAFATRVGSVVLLLFLVQILVPLYRYNMKLSSYYDARADALMIVSTNRTRVVVGGNEVDDTNDPAPVSTSVDALERLVAALSPDYIDFGKAPATPSEHALRFAKDVITSQRK